MTARLPPIGKHGWLAIMRLLFCLFAQDIGLLPLGLFTRIVEGTRRRRALRRAAKREGRAASRASLTLAGWDAFLTTARRPTGPRGGPGPGRRALADRAAVQAIDAYWAPWSPPQPNLSDRRQRCSGDASHLMRRQARDRARPHPSPIACLTHRARLRISLCG